MGAPCGDFIRGDRIQDKLDEIEQYLKELFEKSKPEHSMEDVMFWRAVGKIEVIYDLMGYVKKLRG